MDKSGRVRKRLAVFSDGTWQSAKNETPTNILKLFCALKSQGSDLVPQIAMYDPGLGTVDDLADNWWGTCTKILQRCFGGAFGDGIDVNIKQLYTFLASNYDGPDCDDPDCAKDEGDEIYLFGFSRGAYTVRSVVGFISHCGLLRRHEIAKVDEAYNLYRGKKSSSETFKILNIKPRHVSITLLTCFDTVGALGVPRVLSNWRAWSNYKFHDVRLSQYVLNAIHVLSIDEERKAFQPTLMEAPNDNVKLTQLFFPGTHGGVGGGSAHQEGLSNCTLKFVIDEIGARRLNLEFDMNRVPDGDPCQVITHAKKSMFSEPRKIDGVHMLHDSVFVRYERLKEWRPRALTSIENDLKQYIQNLGRLTTSDSD